jgi:hypothetical protein
MTYDTSLLLQNVSITLHFQFSGDFRNFQGNKRGEGEAYLKRVQVGSLARCAWARRAPAETESTLTELARS